MHHVWCRAEHSGRSPDFLRIFFRTVRSLDRQVRTVRTFFPAKLPHFRSGLWTRKTANSGHSEHFRLAIGPEVGLHRLPSTLPLSAELQLGSEDGFRSSRILSLPRALSLSDAQMEDDYCMIDEHEGLNPGPEPLSPTHKRSAKSTQLPALVLVDFSTACLLQQLLPGGH